MAMARRPISAVAAVSAIATILCLTSLAAQPNPVAGGESELKQNFAAEHEVGRRSIPLTVAWGRHLPVRLTMNYLIWMRSLASTSVLRSAMRQAC
jgi:hypothetical protein